MELTNVHKGFEMDETVLRMISDLEFQESYTGTPKVKEIIETTTVIEVGPEEKALYGKAWNKKKSRRSKTNDSCRLI